MLSAQCCLGVPGDSGVIISASRQVQSLHFCWQKNMGGHSSEGCFPENDMRGGPHGRLKADVMH